MNKYYLRPGGPKPNDRLILLRNIALVCVRALTAGFLLITVQRNFVHRHSDVLWEEEAASNVEESPQEDSEPPAKRKKVAKNQGKKPKGHDFWSMVDEWYSEKMKKLGTKITDSGWKQ